MIFAFCLIPTEAFLNNTEFLQRFTMDYAKKRERVYVHTVAKAAIKPYNLIQPYNRHN